MKFSVGYQFQDENGQPFAKSLCEISEHIHEVYFPWVNTQTCRTSLVNNRGNINWNGQAYLEEDLMMLKKKGIELNLLLNANCYGDKAVSKYLSNHVCSIIDHLDIIGCGIDSVTTTSPFIAGIIKEKYPEIKTRASVNMRIGTIKGMEYVRDIFDGFYMQRDFNRDLGHIKKLREYTEKNGKSLHLLANSGCMSHCSMQTFHDNAVAHETGILETKNVPDYETAGCWRFYSKKENWPSLLQNTWIRPEDLHHYENLFDVVKLATRMNPRPLTVIKAYIEGRFYGNTLALLEPNHTKMLDGHHINNNKFPADFFEKVSSCPGNCYECGYCHEVLNEVLCRS